VLESGAPRQEELRHKPENQIPHTLKKFINYAKQILRNTNHHSVKPNLSTAFYIMRASIFAQQNLPVKFPGDFFLKISSRQQETLIFQLVFCR
jgi:hypothetical protein